MLNYSTEAEPKSERIIVVELKHEKYPSSFRHIAARVYRRALPDQKNPDTGHIRYNDGPNAVGLRNASWSSPKKSALFVEDFIIQDQFDLNSDGPGYGCEARFDDVHFVDARKAKYMYQTLSKIEKGLEKINSKFGYTRNTAQMIVRIASIMDIDTICVWQDGVGPISLADVGNLPKRDCSSLEMAIDKLVSKARGK